MSNAEETGFDVERSLNQSTWTLVASLAADSTSYTDSVDLVSGTTYNYLVRAIDKTMGTFDSNAAEVFATPTGPGTGISTAYTEDFEDEATWAQWTATVKPASKTCPKWKRSGELLQRPLGGSGFYATANHAPCGPPAYLSCPGCRRP